jgi:uncharacterized protein (DUF1015 family)
VGLLLASGTGAGYAGVVPRFQPFPGLRYSPTHIRSLDDVVCPPYDVISEADRVVLAARSPSNVVRLEMPVAEDGEDPYAAAALLLDAWRDGGILHRDRDAAFYGYRMTYRDEAGRTRVTIGVIGALGLEAPGEGILPHEYTTPKARSDRFALLRATRTNLSPIWGLSAATGLTELIGSPRHPAERTTDSEGVLHELWPITARDLVNDITDLVADAPVLIADGHHRFETALAFQAEERVRAGGRDGDHDHVMALVVELAEEQLAVRAIHRLIVGLPEDFDIFAALGRFFDLEPAGALDDSITVRMQEAGAPVLMTPHGVWFARASMATVAAAAHDLDSSRLDVALGAWPAHELQYQHGWDLSAAAVRAGTAQAAVLLRPATVSQIAAVSRGGMRMPAKTTFFWPKPRTGLVLRELID